MTHEFKNIVKEALLAKSQGIKSVLASVVALDGSSYRKPGVRMLILENGKMVGAVSGGCVEKEILLQSETVFNTREAKMMTYDGRYRLGCEGILYILLEIFEPKTSFAETIFNCLNNREPFEIRSKYRKEKGVFSGIGTMVKLQKTTFAISQFKLDEEDSKLLEFKQQMPPCFKLVIIGAEHDAVQLCTLASITGWEVNVVAGVKESKSIDDFPGAHAFQAVSAEQMVTNSIDNETAIVLMTHNFASDLRYLVALKDSKPAYIGILGPVKRRDDLLNQFVEYCPSIDSQFLENIHGPAGLNIGSETPQEIAISIISEILAKTRNSHPVALSEKTGKIHLR
jgi:xanthine/CO dehydrogenase XdhC/CoxF family maturation factor